MVTAGEDESGEVPEYSEATQRVFGRALAVAAKQLSQTQVNALQVLVDEKRFHDVNAIVKAIRAGGSGDAD